MYDLNRKHFYLLNKFKHCCRYIDDLFAINNNKNLLRLKHKIYPPELDITTDDKNNQNVHYLDLDILIKNDKFSHCIYDKRDKFNFPIVSFSKFEWKYSYKPLIQCISFTTSQICSRLFIF